MTGTLSRAAVVGGSIIAFAGNLPESRREDIYLSTMYAQKVTRSAFNDGLSGDWFSYYRNTLRYIGWDVPIPEKLSPMQGDSMATQASRCISTRLGERFSSPMREALAALEKDSLAIELFENTSLSNDIGCFQLIPCVLKDSNRIEMGIYHRQFQTRRTASRFLFVNHDERIYNSTEQMSVITFNSLYYAQFREKVRKAVFSQSMKYLRGLEI